MNDAGQTIAVWFSCGVASAVAAKLTVDLYGEHNAIRILNTPVKEEHKDNRRFLRDVEKWVGQSIEVVQNPKWKSCAHVWSKCQMSNIHGAPCTFHLKKQARYIWEKENHVDWHVLGFTKDEEARHNKFVQTECDNLLPVLIENNFTKQDCFDYVVSAGIEIPKMYKLGYPNANCIGCVKATSPTYWNHVRKTHPKVFEERCVQSDRLNSKLVRYKGERIHLRDLPIDAVGRPMKEFNFECGAFCEEYVNE